MKKLATIILLSVGLAIIACSTPKVLTDTIVIDAGDSASYDLSRYDECEYVFEVRQTGGGDLDIEVLGRRAVYHQGTFKGRTMILSNEYSLFEPKTVDVELTCYGG